MSADIAPALIGPVSLAIALVISGALFALGRLLGSIFALNRHRHEYELVDRSLSGWSLYRCECGAEDIG